MPEWSGEKKEIASAKPGEDGVTWPLRWVERTSRYGQRVQAGGLCSGQLAGGGHHLQSYTAVL